MREPEAPPCPGHLACALIHQLSLPYLVPSHSVLRDLLGKLGAAGVEMAPSLPDPAPHTPPFILARFTKGDR